MKNIELSHKDFINRELSWLEFNERVLEEAQDITNPLFERLKFAAIVSSNLDEFCMVRVGSLWDQVKLGFDEKEVSGLTPQEQIDKISIRTQKMVYDQYNCFNRSLKKHLKKENISFLKEKCLNKEQSKFLESYYNSNIYPVLTPTVVDKSRPFPLISNKSLNIGMLLQNKSNTDEIVFGTVQVPSVLSRFIEIPSIEEERSFILLEDVIKMNLEELFSGHDILTHSCYRITRNADLSLDEEDAEDLLKTIEKSLKQRKWGNVVRLEIESGTDKKLISMLEEKLQLSKEHHYEINGPLDLTFLMKFSGIKGYDYLKYKSIKVQTPKEFLGKSDIFEQIAKGDILLHHPYESFEPVVNLVRKAAEDPNVLAIKQTLYRVSGNSPIVEALAKAAESGKQVTVLVELKARFDEENNIHWARRLEKSGCHVIYGIIGLKIHCKALLVVRMEEDGIKRYVHLGTGNYNDVTANIYTDMSLFTLNPYFGSDVSALFNLLSGHSEPKDMYKISIAPLTLRSKFMALINQEIKHAKDGKKAKIIAKVNSLVDKKIIEALYEASSVGVEIELLVRGICCLRPGVNGISENITVKSIVGRFLEHSRIYYFYNDGLEEMYLSSADWMTRNLNRRVETLFPIEDINLKEKLKQIVDTSFQDTVKARILNSDGTYSRIDKRGKELINSQETFCELALIESERIDKEIIENKEIEFKPITSPEM